MKEDSFEIKFERIVEINRQLESGSAGLEDSIALFKEAAGLIGELTKQLDTAELELIKYQSAAGEDC